MIPGNVVSNNEGAELLVVQYALINASSGDNTLVALVADKKIRVVAMSFLATAAASVRFESNAGGTALTGIMPFPANGGMVLPFNPAGWFETSAGELLNLECDADVDGSLSYVLAE